MTIRAQSPGITTGRHRGFRGGPDLESTTMDALIKRWERLNDETIKQNSDGPSVPQLVWKMVGEARGNEARSDTLLFTASLDLPCLDPLPLLSGIIAVRMISARSFSDERFNLLHRNRLNKRRFASAISLDD